MFIPRWERRLTGTHQDTDQRSRSTDQRSENRRRERERVEATKIEIVIGADVREVLAAFEDKVDAMTDALERIEEIIRDNRGGVELTRQGVTYRGGVDLPEGG